MWQGSQEETHGGYSGWRSPLSWRGPSRRKLGASEVDWLPLPRSPAIAVCPIILAIFSSQTQLLVSTPGHLPRNTKPQLLASPNDFSDRVAEGSSARLKTGMARMGGGGEEAQELQNQEHWSPWLIHFKEGLQKQDSFGQVPTDQAVPTGPAPCPGRPATPHPRRCLRSQGCPPGLERSLCPDLVIMFHSRGNRGPRSIWLRLRTFVSRCATIYRRKTGRIVIS